MFAFFLSAVLMTLLALAILLPILLRGRTLADIDQSQVNIALSREQLNTLDQELAANVISQSAYGERKAEIELSLAQALALQDQQGGSASRGRWLAPVIAIVFPLMAGGAYWKLGTPEALNADFVAANQAANAVARNGGPSESGEGRVPSVQELLPRLEAHLESNPEDLDGWRLLGVTYLRMQRFDDAAVALTAALELVDGKDPDLLLQLADARAMTNAGRLAGEPEALVRRALELRPDDMQGLWLLGMAHQQAGNDQAAIDAWNKVLPQLAQQPELRLEVEGLIAGAEQRLGLAPGSANASVDGTATSAADPAASVTVTVALAEELKGDVPPGMSLFVYAKAASGPPMPLAVSRHTAADLPLTVTLDDSMAMMPQMRLSQFADVIIGARLSQSGQAIAQSGDYYIESEPLSHASENEISLTISLKVE